MSGVIKNWGLGHAPNVKSKKREFENRRFSNLPSFLFFASGYPLATLARDETPPRQGGGFSGSALGKAQPC